MTSNKKPLSACINAFDRQVQLLLSLIKVQVGLRLPLGQPFIQPEWGTFFTSHVSANAKRNIKRLRGGTLEHRSVSQSGDF